MPENCLFPLKLSFQVRFLSARIIRGQHEALGKVRASPEHFVTVVPKLSHASQQHPIDTLEQAVSSSLSEKSFPDASASIDSSNPRRWRGMAVQFFGSLDHNQWLSTALDLGRNLTKRLFRIGRLGLFALHFGAHSGPAALVQKCRVAAREETGRICAKSSLNHFVGLSVRSDSSSAQGTGDVTNQKSDSR